MANTLAPFGFMEAYRLSGAPTFQQSRRRIAAGNATVIYKNDPVVQLASGYITQATAGTTQIAGIFVGCEYVSVSQKKLIVSPYWPGTDANGDVTAYIIDDPMAVFRVQTNGSGALPATLTALGNNANFAIGTGSTNTGNSGAMIDISTIATTSTLPFRFVDLVLDPPGSNGADITTAFNWVYVAFNWQDYKSTTGI